MTQTNANDGELDEIVDEIIDLAITAGQFAGLKQEEVSKDVEESRNREAKLAIQSLLERRELEAEDKALDYAVRLYDLTKQWPDYYRRHLNGEKYRKDHKDVKIAFRKAELSQRGERTRKKE